MLRNIINAITNASRALFGNWKTAVVFVALYAAFMFSLYLFFTTPVARIWQVILTFALIILIPVLFFVLQTMSMIYTNDEQKAGALLARSWRDFWKLLVISLPVILLTWLVIWGLTTLDSTMATGWREAAYSADTSDKIKAAQDKIKMLGTFVSWASALILYFIVPLFSIQLWISVLKNGLLPTVKSIFRLILKAYAPRSVLTYLIGLVVFGLVPYFIITTRTPIKSPWLDLSLLGMRIAIALLVILIGWVVTLGAMKLLTTESATNTEMPQAEQA